MAVSLKQWLDSNPAANRPAGFLHVPEVGDGVQVALRRLTLGEFRAITSDDFKGREMERMEFALPLCVCRDDGGKWDGPPLADVVPFAAVLRIVSECVRVNQVDVNDAKKRVADDPVTAMLFEVALGLGRTVAEVLLMDAAEFEGWCGFFAARPFGARQRTMEAGTVAMAAASAFGGSKLRPHDFFPSLEPPRPKGSSAFRAWASARCPAMANRPKPPRPPRSRKAPAKPVP